MINVSLGAQASFSSSSSLLSSLKLSDTKVYEPDIRALVRRQRLMDEIETLMSSLQVPTPSPQRLTTY